MNCFVVLRYCIGLVFILVSADCWNSDGCPHLVKETKYHADIFKGTCYMFVNHERYWGPAAQYCLDMGGDLVTINSKDVQEFLAEKLWSNELGWRNNGVWIGARYYEDSGWIWTTGEKVQYSNWASGQPGKFLDWISFENCAAMKRGDGWKWHDFHCKFMKFHYKFICQFPLAQTVFQSGQSSHSATAGAIDNGNTLILVVVISLAVLFIIIMLIIFFIYRRRQQVKHTREVPAVRFDNLDYAQLHAGQQNIDNDNRSRPSSNIYLTPSEVNTPHSETNKEACHGNEVYGKDGQVRSDPLPPIPTEPSDGSVAGEEQGACGGSEPLVSEPLMSPDKSAEAKPKTVESNRLSNAYVDMSSMDKTNVEAGSTCMKEVETSEVEPLYSNVGSNRDKSESIYEHLP